MIIFQIACACLALAGLMLTVYWLIGAHLYDRSTAKYHEALQAYQRGDLVAGNRLAVEGDRRQVTAKRFSLGARSSR